MMTKTAAAFVFNVIVLVLSLFLTSFTQRLATSIMRVTLSQIQITFLNNCTALRLAIELVR